MPLRNMNNLLENGIGLDKFLEWKLMRLVELLGRGQYDQ